MTKTLCTLSLQKATSVKSLPSSVEFKTWIGAALTVAGFKKQCEITIRLVDDAESHALNLQYRGKDKATNVLSFASELPEEVLDALAREPLGDMVICVPVVLLETQQQAKTATAHWAHLTIHSTLHLLGFDHVEESEAEEMEALEVIALANLGYANPYELVE